MAPSTPSRALYAILLLPVILAAPMGGCHCGPKPPPDTDTDTSPPPVEIKVQVVSIDPSSVDANKAFDARVYGSGFKDGATVAIGGQGASRVTVEDDNTLSLSMGALAAGTYDVVVTDPDGSTAKLRQGLNVRATSLGDCRSLTLHFGFDDAGLDGSSKTQLDGNIPCYQASQGKINISGHADERGTTEYNLALGQRRAETVERYLANNGIAASRVTTVSYGEEKPAAFGHDEASWAQNRRAEIHASQ